MKQLSRLDMTNDHCGPGWQLHIFMSIVKNKNSIFNVINLRLDRYEPFDLNIILLKYKTIYK